MVEWKTLQDITNDEAASALWNAAQSSTMNLYAMYNSLQWLSCHTDEERRQIAVAVRRDPTDSARVGFAAMSRRPVPLRFQFSRSREFSYSIRSLELLGSEFVGEQGYEALAEVVESVWLTHGDVDAIYLKSVSSESPLWQTLAACKWKIGNTAIYKPDAERPFHYVALPPTHEEYMASFGSKQRFTLKKKIRKINEAFPGAVELRRITDAADLEFLTDSARQVVAKSWKAQELARAVPESIENQRFLRAVADKGLLRSHVLLANGTACAFVVGYFYNGIYHYADLAYDTEYADHSPGTVLLLLMIEDLIRQDQAKFINFGITDAQYKRVFGNRHVEDAALLLLRPSLATGLRVGIHRGFRDAKAFAKRVLKK
jgi:hypothetical protein